MNHWLKVELDESTGKVTAKAFCSAAYGPEGKQRDCTVSADVALPDGVHDALKQALGAVLETNRAAIEKEARKARAAAEYEAERRNEFDDVEEQAPAAPEATA